MLSHSYLFNTAAVACVLGTMFLLFRPRVAQSERWRATVTPLASIIGSGFLVVAPLLHHIVHVYAGAAMLGIVLLAYAIGSVLRYNIHHVEPLLDDGGSHRYLFASEQVANFALALAYLVSVAFYLRLMASFLLQGIDIEDDFLANVITTAFLLFILVTGVLRGLGGLEKLEEFAVSIKLAIIAALLFGLLVHDVNWLVQGAKAIEPERPDDLWNTLRLLGGVLLVVQGFETSRYLGDEYDAEQRVRTMRSGQIIAGIIYIVFVVLALPVMIGFDREPSETAIIDLSGKVAVVLPVMLILAAVMSQFSAAVADTVGAGGLVEEASAEKVKSATGYVIVCVLAIILVWTSDIFQIISLASRAFAFYYAVQCVSAILATWQGDAGTKSKLLRSTAFTLLGTVLLLITLFAQPAGH